MNYSVKISGHGSLDQISNRLIELSNAIQVANIYNDFNGLKKTNAYGLEKFKSLINWN